MIRTKSKARGRKPTKDCFYTGRDICECGNDRAFLAVFQDRLRRVLAEAVPSNCDAAGVTIGG
jgi:hypothetical protein